MYCSTMLNTRFVVLLGEIGVTSRMLRDSRNELQDVNIIVMCERTAVSVSSMFEKKR